MMAMAGMFRLAPAEQRLARCEVLAETATLTGTQVMAVLTTQRLVLCQVPARAFRLVCVLLFCTALIASSYDYRGVEDGAIVAVILATVLRAALPYRRIIVELPLAQLVGTSVQGDRLSLVLRDGAPWALTRPTMFGGLPFASPRRPFMQLRDQLVARSFAAGLSRAPA